MVIGGNVVILIIPRCSIWSIGSGIGSRILLSFPNEITVTLTAAAVVLPFIEYFHLSGVIFSKRKFSSFVLHLALEAQIIKIDEMLLLNTIGAATVLLLLDISSFCSSI